MPSRGAPPTRPAASITTPTAVETRHGALAAIGNTPLIELATLRTPGHARVFVKWEGANPTGSMKDRMALAMIEGASRDGLLKPGQRVVEYTGGSTGPSVAFVCAVKGHPVTIVTADCFSLEKAKAAKALGAHVEVLATPDKKTTPKVLEDMMARVREIQKETGAYWTDQLRNRHQADGYAPMAREILAQCPGITDLVQVVGSGGSSMGNIRVLRRTKPDIRLTLAEPSEAAYLSGAPPGRHKIDGIAIDTKPALIDRAQVDAIETAPEAEARAMARRIAAEEGLFAGTSTGLNLVVAQRVAARLPEDAAVVTVAIDTGFKYLAGDLYADVAVGVHA